MVELNATFIRLCFLIVSNQKLRKFLEWKWFSEKVIHNVTDSGNLLNHRRSSYKNLEVTLLFIDLFKDFYSICRGKMEQILLVYGLPEETVTAIMMLYSKIKVKVHLPDGDTDFFDIVANVLQGDTLVPYLFIICLDYVLWTSVELIKRKWLYSDIRTNGKTKYLEDVCNYLW